MRASKYPLGPKLNLNYRLPPSGITPKELEILRMITGSTCARQFQSEILKSDSDDIYQQCLLFAFEPQDIDVSLPTARISSYLKQYVFWRMSKYIRKYINKTVFDSENNPQFRIIETSQLLPSDLENETPYYEPREVETPLDVAISNEERRIDAESLAKIRRALPFISARNRYIFVQTTFYGVSYVNAGQSLGISSARVQALYQQTIQEIRDVLAYLEHSAQFYYDKTVHRYVSARLRRTQQSKATVLKQGLLFE